MIALGNQVGNRAVVLGGSMAGLLACRVLSDYYGEVLVVDRDVLAGVSGARRGVPQGGHAHALLARGQQVLEELFPGLTSELQSGGAPIVDIAEMNWIVEGRRMRQTRSGLRAVSTSRPDLESCVRNRVLARPNVRFLEQHDIAGIVATPERDRITGVRVQSREDGADPVLLEADLVVDASGRGSRIPVWLEDFGYQRPQEERVKIGLSYTTCEYLLPDSPLEENRSVIPLATPASPRGAFFGRTGHQRHILSLTGMLGDQPGPGIEGFLDYARSLPVDDIYEAIRDADPVSAPTTIRFPASQRRHYELLERFPRGLLIVGDSVCSFNPVYGQGMTVSAQEAVVLGTHLATGSAPDPIRFFRDISSVIDAPWEIAAGGDLGWPGVEGRRTVKTRIANTYISRLQYAATKDAAITGAFMRVAGLVDPPSTLMRPGLVLRVLKNSRGGPPPRPEYGAEANRTTRTSDKLR